MGCAGALLSCTAMQGLTMSVASRGRCLFARLGGREAAGAWQASDLSRVFKRFYQTRLRIRGCEHPRLG
eukprot:4026135-Prymnesium_polylepis.1